MTIVGLGLAAFCLAVAVWCAFLASEDPIMWVFVVTSCISAVFVGWLALDQG